MKKLLKIEAKEEIDKFFENIKKKNSTEIKKIKRLAMRYNIQLGNLRKKFCKKCFTPYKNPKIRIRDNMKIIICKNCGYVSRWRINNL